MLSIDERYYGPEHAATAGAFENVGWDLKELNRAAEALPNAERSIEIHGREKPDLTLWFLVRSARQGRGGLRAPFPAQEVRA